MSKTKLNRRQVLAASAATGVAATAAYQISAQENVASNLKGPNLKGKSIPVSYTHLTLPTTPYV